MQPGKGSTTGMGCRLAAHPRGRTEILKFAEIHDDTLIGRLVLSIGGRYLLAQLVWIDRVKR